MGIEEVLILDTASEFCDEFFVVDDFADDKGGVV